jgi:hypothetical protein
MKNKIEISLPSINIEGIKIINQTLKIFIQNFWSILTIVCLVAIPVEVINLIVAFFCFKAENGRIYRRTGIR